MTDAKITLEAKLRKEKGKAVKMLRKNGLIPANIFGQDFESQSITLGLKDFQTTYRKAGETGIIYIQVDGKTVPTLLSNLQYHPVLGSILHVDFRKVNLKQKIEAHVPLVLINESDAVTLKNGVLLTQIDVVTVEALPADIPHQFDIDLSKLKEIGDQIAISDLPKSAEYVIKDEPETVIVSVTEHKEESIEPEIVSEAPEITGEVPTEEGATEEGAAPGGEEQKEAPTGDEKSDKS